MHPDRKHRFVKPTALFEALEQQVDGHGNQHSARQIAAAMQVVELLQPAVQEVIEVLASRDGAFNMTDQADKMQLCTAIITGLQVLVEAAGTEVLPELNRLANAQDDRLGSFEFNVARQYTIQRHEWGE